MKPFFFLIQVLALLFLIRLVVRAFLPSATRRRKADNRPINSDPEEADFEVIDEDEDEEDGKS